MLNAIASSSPAPGGVPLGVAVARLSTHLDAAKLPSVVWLPTKADATVLVFARREEALDAVTGSLAAAYAHCGARTGAAPAKPAIIASTHVEKLTVPSLLARASGVLVLADATAEQALCLVGVNTAGSHIPDSCRQPSALWRQDGAVCAVELALWATPD